MAVVLGVATEAEVTEAMAEAQAKWERPHLFHSRQPDRPTAP